MLRRLLKALVIYGWFAAFAWAIVSQIWTFIFSNSLVYISTDLRWISLSLSLEFEPGTPIIWWHVHMYREAWQLADWFWLPRLHRDSMAMSMEIPWWSLLCAWGGIALMVRRRARKRARGFPVVAPRNTGPSAAPRAAAKK